MKLSRNIRFRRSLPLNSGPRIITPRREAIKSLALPDLIV